MKRLREFDDAVLTLLVSLTLTGFVFGWLTRHNYFLSDTLQLSLFITGKIVAVVGVGALVFLLLAVGAVHSDKED